MNDTYTVEPCICEEKEQSVSDIVRENSSKIRCTFNNLAHIRQFVDGTSEERSLNDKEPMSMMEEVLWQRSMLCRIDEELFNINHKLGC